MTDKVCTICKKKSSWSWMGEMYCARCMAQKSPWFRQLGIDTDKFYAKGYDLVSNVDEEINVGLPE